MYLNCGFIAASDQVNLIIYYELQLVVDSCLTYTYYWHLTTYEEDWMSQLYLGEWMALGLSIPWVLLLNCLLWNVFLLVIILICFNNIIFPYSFQEEATAIKAAGKAWYHTMVSDSDYTEFDNFTKWLGVSQWSSFIFSY